MTNLELDYIHSEGHGNNPIILLVGANRPMTSSEARTVASGLAEDDFIAIPRWRPAPLGWHVKASRPA
jgi:hypothetical protein